MTHDKPERLDRLLQRWADQHAPRDVELDRLRERIVQSFRDDSLCPFEPASVRRPGGSRRRSALWFTMVVAATLLITIGLSWLLQPENDGVKSTANLNGLPPSYAWLRESQLRDKAILLNEIESVFERQAAWLLEAGEDVSIGVVQRPARTEAKPVTVRVVVERRIEGQSDWTIMWAADVIARSEEVVQIGPDSPSGAELVMWAFVLPDGMIEIDADLTLCESPAVRMTTSSLQKGCEPVKVHSTYAGGYEFRLFQTAAVLDEPVT